MQRLLLPILVALATQGMALAQTADTGENTLPPLPAAPPDQILDEARLLDPSTRAKLRFQIQKLKREANVDLFVVAYTLLSEDIDARARRLRSLWATSGRCVVIVYRRGSRQLTFSASGDAGDFIPTGEMLLMYDDAVAAARAYELPRENILAAVETLTTAIIADLTVRDTQRGAFTTETLKLIATLIAALLVIGGISLIIVLRLQRRRVARDTGLLFPELTVGRRLGAAFGGGTVAALNFGPPPVEPAPPANPDQAAPDQAAPVSAPVSS